MRRRPRDIDPRPDAPMEDLPSARVRTLKELRIPIRPYVYAELYVPFPMTSGDWDQFMAVLAAMKPGLVRDLVEQFDDPALTSHD